MQESTDALARRRRKSLKETTALTSSHRSKPEATGPPANPPDEFVPDPQIAREFGITLMTLWRWTRDATLGFPPPINIRGKNFRSRKLIEQFKQDMLRKAIRERGKQQQPKAAA